MNNTRTAIGVDLGGTKVEVALVSPGGKIEDRERTPTGEEPDPETVVRHIRQSAEKLLSKHTGFNPSTLGIGVAGQIADDHSRVKYAPNLSWNDVNLGEMLSESLELPVTVSNDVRAATFGEWQLGAGKGVKDLLCMFIGTGIGGGIVSNGHLQEGYNNTTGEIGHMVIQIDGPDCHCGMKGCFEALAGGWALERDARAAVRQHQTGADEFLKLVDGDVESITARTVAEAFANNNPLASRLISHLEKVLSLGAASLVNAIGPAQIVLGGGIISGFPHLVEVIQKNIQSLSLNAAAENVKVVQESLNGDSGVVGAAAMALQKN